VADREVPIIVRKAEGWQPAGAKPGTPEWRLMHLQAGDDFLRRAEKVEAVGGGGGPAAAFLVSMAAAHYTAANVRYRPAAPEQEASP